MKVNKVVKAIHTSVTQTIVTVRLKFVKVVQNTNT